MAKVTKSEKIRHALSLKSNAEVSVADLAKTLNVQPGLIYAIKYKAKNGKGKKQASKARAAAASQANGSVAGSNLVDHGSFTTAVAPAQSGGTLTQTLALIQEAAVVLSRLRALIG